MAETLYVQNGIVELGDIVTIMSYRDPNRYLYQVTGFRERFGMPQVHYIRVHPDTLEIFPEVLGSWFDYSEAAIELWIIYKRKYFGGYKRV